MADGIPLPRAAPLQTRADVVAKMRWEARVRRIEGLSIIESEMEHRVELERQVAGRLPQRHTVDVRGARALGFDDWLTAALRAVGVPPQDLRGTTRGIEDDGKDVG